MKRRANVSSVGSSLLGGLLALLVTLIVPRDLVAQELVGDSFSPESVSIAKGWVYWGVSPAEQCGVPGARRGQVLRTPGGGGVVDVSAIGCDLNPISVETDGLHVYYLNWADGTVERVWEGGGPREVLAEGNFTYRPDGLAIDSAYVYWTDLSGIRRVPKDGGTGQTIVAGVDASMIALDANYVYFSEGSAASPGSGALSRAPKDGGARERLRSGIDRPPFLAVDATRIFWTEQNAGVYRMSKAGGPATRIASGEAGFQPGGIAIDDTHVFWTDGAGGLTGRVRRVPKTGGATQNLVLGDIARARSVVLDDTHVYYGATDDRGRSGVWRLPKDASAALDDLRTIDWEVTQVLQSLDNEIPMIAEKPTWIRLWARSTRAVTPNVRAVLEVRRGGTFVGSVRSIQPSMTLRPGTPMNAAARETLSTSFNFVLPTEWANGTLTLRVILNPERTIPESDYGNNVLSRTFSFEAEPEICVSTINVRTAGARHYGPRTIQFHSAIQRFISMWPINDVHVTRLSGDVAELEVCWWEGIVPYPCYGPYELSQERDRSNILSSIERVDWFTDDPDSCPGKPFYMGIVKGNAPPIGKGGLGRIGEPYSYVRITAQSRLQTSDGHTQPPGGITMAHELAHNVGRRHVECGADESIDHNYPFCLATCSSCPCCAIGNAGYRDIYGFDPLTERILVPTEHKDFMAYRDSRWCSSYTWLGIYDLRNFDFRNLGGGGAGDVETLLISGTVNLVEGTGTIGICYRTPPGFVSDDDFALFEERRLERLQLGATHELAFVDILGRVLATYPFRPGVEIDEEGVPDEELGFTMVVPWRNAFLSVRLRSGEETLASKGLFGRSPTVRILEPNGGETITDRLLVRWEADDPDDVQDPFFRLYATVQYSADGGRRWQVLSLDNPTGEVDLTDIDDLPGSNRAMVRVIVTDGSNTAVDTSDAFFTVEDRPPAAFIMAPENGAVFDPGEQIVLMGSGWDPEDGMLGDPDLLWSVGGMDLTRSGRQVVLPGFGPGRYVLTLVGEDSSRQRASSQIVFYVSSGGGSQLPSDINQDGALDVSDSIALLDHLFIGSPAFRVLPCGEGALSDAGNIALLDANGDSQVDLSDGVYVLQYLFVGGRPPVLGTSCVTISDCPESPGCP